MNRARSGPDATNFFQNIDRTFSSLNDKLEKSVREHLRDVYATLAIGLATAAVGAAVHLFTDILRMNFLLSLGSIGLMMALISTPHTPQNHKKRLGYFLGFCFISGLSMGPLLEHVIRIDPSIILTALLSTVFVFGAFSLASLHAERTKYLYLGGTLASASLALLFASLFARYYAFHSVLLWGGLVISCGFILYDTQLIVEKNRRGDTDFLWHAIELFIDFVQVFRYLLVLLSDKKEDNRRRRRD